MRKPIFMTRLLSMQATLICLVAATVFMAAPARADTDIVEVTSPEGIKAWLVEDLADPMITVSFAFSGGAVQDARGKEGTAVLLANLLTEGAGELDAEAFQKQLYETGAELSFSAEEDVLSGTLRMLADETEEPLRLLSLALASPRFDEASLERERARMISSLKERSKDPDERGNRALAKALYGDHPLARQATAETVQAIDQADLVDLHRRMLARDNLSIGVAGAVDRESLAGVLDAVFSDLPAENGLETLKPPRLQLGKRVHETYDRPQSAITAVYRGVSQKDTDYYAAEIATNILGGGADSRIFLELREKRGLTYGAYATLQTEPDWGRLYFWTTTRAQVPDTWQLMREVAERFAEEGPTEKELEDAKKYMVGAYLVNGFRSTAAIAGTLVQLQQENRDRGYPQRLKELYGAITADEVKAVTRRLLAEDPTVLVVGPEVD
ncbi:M16 family metallopeptidase [Nitratireductor sp. GCM10026969]|uniref:M16 family metallopeptidase n=1 Tax=Nitratireductor sp. GCM10026969 TaxID=3252645 RepID=UPI0036203276